MSRSWQGLHRHALMTMIAYAFLQHRRLATARRGESRYGHGDVLAVPGIKQDGAGVSIEFTIVLLRDGAGELTGLAAIMRDVTKRFEETRALKQKLAEAAKLSR
jgi:PAS domain S-box-containing protein